MDHAKGKVGKQVVNDSSLNRRTTLGGSGSDHN